MKKILVVLVLISLIPLAYAASIELAEFYGPVETLSGTITLALEDFPADSNLVAEFNSLTRNAKLIDFLNNANADYTCTPADCSSTYAASSPGLTKRLSNGYVALNIGSGKNVKISQIAFNISGSSDVKSCGFVPIGMDILDDGTTDWQYMEPDNIFCDQLSPSSTYNSGVAEATYNIVSEPYCEKINLIKSGKFKLGADIVKGSVESNIYLALTDGIKREECEISNENGLQTCEVNFAVSEEGPYYLCVYSSDDESDTMIKGEIEQPSCGQFGLTEFECNETSIDYALYSQPAFFKGFTEKAVFDATAFSEFTNNVLEIYIQDYIDTNYGADCSLGCVIPIKVMSNQELTFSDLNFKYLTSLGAKTEKNFYSVQKNAAKIIMAEQKLALDAAEFITPLNYGTYSLRILLNNILIDEKEISIKEVPMIKSFSPLLVPAATSTKFIVLAESPKGNSIVSYDWDFGDNGLETTTAPYAAHIYGIGEYALKLKITDSEGLSTQRIFQIKAEEPKAIVNMTIEKKKQNLESFKKEIVKIPKWYSSLVSINADELEAKLAEFEANYETSTDYVSLKIGLDELFVPSKITEERLESQMHSEPNADLIAAIDNSEADEQTSEKIKVWNNANAVITAYYTVKSAVEDDKTEALTTEYKIEAKSKGQASFENIYLIIDSASPLVFKSNYPEYSMQKVDDATGFIITLDNEGKIIEFAAAGSHSADEFTIFVSPSLEILKSGEEVICGDNLCDKAKGESYESCSLDCKKPYGKAITWIVIVLIIVAAGMLGIWKYYAVKYDQQLREKLFKPKEDFYKLSFFISNEINQGKDDEEIKENLENAGWKKSQVDYALRKTKQSRTTLQKKSLLAYAKKELYSRKSEDEIRDGLLDAGWKSSLVNWALKNAKTGK
jgi:hypothetical protein